MIKTDLPPQATAIPKQELESLWQILENLLWNSHENLAASFFAFTAKHAFQNGISDYLYQTSNIPGDKSPDFEALFNLERAWPKVLSAYQQGKPEISEICFQTELQHAYEIGNTSANTPLQQANTA